MFRVVSGARIFRIVSFISAFLADATLSLIFGVLLLPNAAHSAPPRVLSADLALIFTPQQENSISAADVIAPLTEALLPRDVLQQVSDAYMRTAVGNALEAENAYSDWKLVSTRIVPCSPLGVVPSANTQIFCWPELRLVWQPIISNFRRYTVILPSFADDRAIHALYDVNPLIALNSADATRARLLLTKIRTALESSPASPLKILSNEELLDFQKLRNKVTEILMQKALDLRSGRFSENSYSTLTERPEFSDPTAKNVFIGKFKILLAALTSRQELKELTSFSLPEGRDPPQIDDWVFIQFLRQNGSLAQQNIKLRSAIDGRTLFNFGTAPRASQMRDAPEIHTALETMNSKDANEIKQRVLLSPQELPSKKDIISDRNLTLVPNTSCGSCHKLNSLRFDFHALSYLEDRDVSISSRVKTDVQRDLEWLQRFPAP